MVFQVDAHDLMGVVNRDSPRLILNDLARELFWLCLERRIVILVEWVPREENSLADKMSKLIIPDDWMLQRALFQELEQRWGRHFADLFASNATNQCAFFLFAALVPRFGGGQRICVPLGHRPSMGQLPIPALGPGVKKVEERRGSCHSARPVVAVVYVVGVVGARWRVLL